MAVVADGTGRLESPDPTGFGGISCGISPIEIARRWSMQERRYLFPGVIELNVQARRRLGVNIYLIDGGTEYGLIDVGFLDELPEVLELIRQMGFPLSACRWIVATHADVDHSQGLARAREVLKCPVVAHPKSVAAIESGDEIMTYARIDAQNIHIPMPPCKVDRTVEEGSRLEVGGRSLEVWSTPGHTAGQLAFRMGELLFSGDNIFRDGSVGVIDAHHGSSLPEFLASLRRIREADVEWLLPSHGPVFRKDRAVLDATIRRLESYTHLADFGTCAVDWPLLDEWDEELVSDRLPTEGEAGRGS
jgi:glyoxylase-like metal-dependent hydrolase (beta-lactamase superfamily II)